MTENRYQRAARARAAALTAEQRSAIARSGGFARARKLSARARRRSSRHANNVKKRRAAEALAD